MTSTEAVPTKLPSNQFDHFYRGGYRIGKLRNGPGGPMRPEEWIGSTTTRFGENATGLSKLADGTLLKDAIDANPVPWLGQKHLDKFGASTEILVKLLDPDQRLPVHYHPDQKFAAEKLHVNHGKTEAWIILEAPPKARVGLGFNRQMEKSEVAALVAAHDSEGLLESLVFTEVTAGDGVFCADYRQLEMEKSLFLNFKNQQTFQFSWSGMASRLTVIKTVTSTSGLTVHLMPCDFRRSTRTKVHKSSASLMRRPIHHIRFSNRWRIHFFGLTISLETAKKNPLDLEFSSVCQVQGNSILRTPINYRCLSVMPL